MKKNQNYKIIILVLFVAVILEGLFIISRKPQVVVKEQPRRPKAAVLKGKIAIVLDDWGYTLNNLSTLKQIKQPVTLAILPNLNYSKTISEKVYGRNETILHLPMEPLENLRLEKNTIIVSMDASVIRDILTDDLKSVPFAKGVSNHMGSKATRNKEVMSVVFKELKDKRLYFLDSFVTGGSICADLAQKYHLRFAERDVFLDNIEEPGYILKQLDKLKLRANLYGEAIGIGHDRKVTLRVLKEALPLIEKEGYKFVFLSELVK